MLASDTRMILHLYIHSNKHVPQNVSRQWHFVDQKKIVTSGLTFSWLSPCVAEGESLQA